ncbi:MAG: collagen-like protein [Fluviicola sp.]|nr:collagen-like protein [Fluviicola sp.]
MKNLFILFVSVLFLISCGSSKKFNVAEIASIYMEYNPAADLNYGKEFQATIFARMLDGREVDITKKKKLSFISEDIKKLSSKNTFLVVKKPTSFTDETISVSYAFSGKEETFTDAQTIKMNLRGSLIILADGIDGENGVNRKSRTGRIIFRDGKDGENGGNGTFGTNAKQLTCYIWKKGNYNYVSVNNLTNNEVWKYKFAVNGTLLVNASGGDGGNGGRGGNGGSGQNGEINKNNKQLRVGDGGDGGNGGNGGNGGDGSVVNVFIHPSASSVSSSITVVNIGGTGGRNGTAGTAGNPGKPLSGQLLGRKGRVGLRGIRGVAGVNGPPPSITVIDFDISQYE